MMMMMQGRRESLVNFIFYIFDSCSEVSVAHSKVTVAPNFPSFSCGHLGTCGKGGYPPLLEPLM